MPEGTAEARSLQFAALSHSPMSSQPQNRGSAVGLVARASAAAASPSVLLVDDEEGVRVAMRRYMTRLGWTVSEAADGECARALLDPARGLTFDLVICDLRMPRLSGPELFRWLASNRPDAAQRLVFSSGDLHAPESMEFLSQAQRPVLPKPFELSDLARVVEQICTPAHAA
jgi:CheY-like chemotaxis protein